jgi:hypothetical protein
LNPSDFAPSTIFGMFSGVGGIFQQQVTLSSRRPGRWTGLSHPFSPAGKKRQPAATSTAKDIVAVREIL